MFEETSLSFKFTIAILSYFLKVLPPYKENNKNNFIYSSISRTV